MADTPITVDGSRGGGQILRTALSLSTVLDTPFRIEHIRRGRPTPGLRSQHLAAVEVVAELCDGEVSGAELGAESLMFEPGSARRTPVEATIGTAGSVTLLFDTVLPIGAFSSEPLALTATGGTDVKWSPTVAYQRLVKCPLLASQGVNAEIDVERTGFYPAGGGRAVVRTAPSSPSPIRIDSRGELLDVEVHSKAAETLREPRVAERQAEHARDLLGAAGLPASVVDVAYVPSRSTGSSLLVRGRYAETVVGFSALGERGRPSEAVADAAVERFRAFHGGSAPVDQFMADQVMVFLALAGGRVRIPAATDHVRTNLETVARFGSDMRLDRRSDGTCVLEASAHPALG